MKQSEDSLTTWIPTIRKAFQADDLLSTKKTRIDINGNTDFQLKYSKSFNLNNEVWVNGSWRNVKAKFDNHLAIRTRRINRETDDVNWDLEAAQLMKLSDSSHIFLQSSSAKWQPNPYLKFIRIPAYQQFCKDYEITTAEELYNLTEQIPDIFISENYTDETTITTLVGIPLFKIINSNGSPISLKWNKILPDGTIGED